MINKVYTILRACNCSLAYNQRPTLKGKKLTFDGTFDFDGSQDLDGYNNEGICIAYHFFNEKGEAFEDGEDTEISSELQVDLFAMDRVDFTSIKKQIKQILKDNKFRSPSSYDTQEDVVGVGLINHVVITSNYLESEVLNNG